MFLKALIKQSLTASAESLQRARVRFPVELISWETEGFLEFSLNWKKNGRNLSNLGYEKNTYEQYK